MWKIFVEPDAQIRLEVRRIVHFGVQFQQFGAQTVVVIYHISEYGAALSDIRFSSHSDACRIRSCEVVSVHTLNVLAKFAGSSSWDDFCNSYKEHSSRQSEELELKGKFLDVSMLNEEDTLRLGWLPDRLIEARYLGSHRFEVTRSVNSSIRPGDRFSCLMIQKGRELFLDKFIRSGSDREASYVVGQKQGITTIEVLI